MRLDAWFVSTLFAQTSDGVSAPPWALGIAMLITALGAIVGPPLRALVKARAEREAAEAIEDAAQRKARREAELDQIRVVTSLASSIPALTEEIRKDRHEREQTQRQEREAFVATMVSGFAQLRETMTSVSRAVEANTRATDALTGELHSDRDEMQRKIAEAVGAESKPARSALRSRPDLLPQEPPLPAEAR